MDVSGNAGQKGTDAAGWSSGWGYGEICGLGGEGIAWWKQSNGMRQVSKVRQDWVGVRVELGRGQGLDEQWLQVGHGLSVTGWGEGR